MIELLYVTYNYCIPSHKQQSCDYVISIMTLLFCFSAALSDKPAVVPEDDPPPPTPTRSESVILHLHFYLDLSVVLLIDDNIITIVTPYMACPHS